MLFRSEKELPRYADLSGVGLPATVTAACGQAFTGGTLFTHRGLSGPAVLQTSSYWQPGEPVWVDFLPGLDLAARLAQEQADRPMADIRTVLSELLPKRVAQRLCELAFDPRPLRRYSDTELRAAAERVQHWEFRPIGTEGYRTAEVTLGGVDTDGLSSSTLGSKLAPGLHFVGEVVDVTGHLGGFNFQWAWASGHAAGLAV